MKVFFKKSGAVVGCVLAAVLLILLIVSAFGGGIHSLRGVVTPLDKLVNAGMDKLEQVYGYMYNYDKLVAENAELRSRIAEMEETVRQSVSSNEENARLKKLLGLAEANDDYEFVDAALISWSASGWSSSFTINKGSKHGLEVGDCVVTEDGFLIGQITRVSRSGATVQTILDSASGVGALTDKDVTAVAEGDFNLMSEGKLRLVYIEDTSRVVSGDKVMTSGKGGIYPSGLVIGTVESVSIDPSGLSASAIVEPDADIAATTYVFIITDYEPEE
ncbi:MAG: rod shape-determining protein MreC [Oscillospiraceae bacterium]|nr:rod shape-determining protein MreC [Oscillospiraceae bacterium]